jgi:hypothetical protein
MHVNFKQTHDKYSEAELLHLQQCYQCQQDAKSLEQLKKSATLIPIIVPEELNWQAIKQRTTAKKHVDIQPKSKVTRPYFFQQVIGIAASTFFIAVGWLVWNNHQLQSQLEQVLMVNQSLELQLAQDQIPTFRQAKLLNKVRLIEENLIYAQSQKEKLQLLKERQKLVAEMVRYQGEDDEISI